MRYELLLNRRPGEQLDFERTEAALAARHPLEGPPGDQVWKVPGAQPRVTRVVEGGDAVAVSLGLGLGESAADVERVLSDASAVASELGVVLFDSQLSREVGAHDAAAVSRRFDETVRYAGTILGVPEAVYPAFGQSPVGIGRNVKIALAIIVGGVVALRVLTLLLGL